MLACCIDRNYVELAAVMFRSAHVNGQIPFARFCVLGDGLRPSDKVRLERSAGRPVTFIDLDSEAISRISGFPTSNAWTRIIYGRLFLPRLVGSECHRILYLDGDTLVKKDISALFTMDLGKDIAAAVGANHSEWLATNNRRLGRPPETFYFNSGVLLIDVARWNAAGLTEASLELLGRGGFDYPDQDVLNLVLQDQVHPLSWHWNAQKATDFSKARIVHFTHEKPNTRKCRHPEKSAFLAMRESTAWAGRPLHSNLSKRLSRLRYSIRRRLGRLRAWLVNRSS